MGPSINELRLLTARALLESVADQLIELDASVDLELTNHVDQPEYVVRFNENQARFYVFQLAHFVDVDPETGEVLTPIKEVVGQC